MYMHVKKLVATTLPLCLSVLLSACGGAPADEPSSNPSSVINKPQVSSAEASSLPSSATPSSVPSPVATSASSTSATASSLPKSSTDSYSRISRASSSLGSSSSGNSDSGVGSSSPASAPDTIPPTSTKLTLYQLAENSLRLKWDDATDNVGISHYEIERNNQLIAILQHPTNILSDYQLLAYTDYHYTITAFDAAGNKSEKSPVFTVRTLANANSSHSNSSKSSTSSANSSANSSSANTNKTTTIRWNHPNKRENGQFLELDEIGGYEIRFKQPAYNNYTYILLTGNRTTSFSTDLIPTNSTIEIAVYDTNKLYSSFTSISAEVD